MSEGTLRQHRSGSPAWAQHDSTTLGPSRRSTRNATRGSNTGRTRDSNPRPFGSLATASSARRHATCTPGDSSKLTWYPGRRGYSRSPSALTKTSGDATAAATKPLSIEECVSIDTPREGFEQSTPSTPETPPFGLLEFPKPASRPRPAYADPRTSARPTPCGARSRTGRTKHARATNSSNPSRTDRVFVVVVVFGGGEDAPTSAPTLAPTSAPTSAPTRATKPNASSPLNPPQTPDPLGVPPPIASSSAASAAPGVLPRPTTGVRVRPPPRAL
mmetsp:Transcript_12705/g.57337  ORF Transcript_12705/g.57337 Transcript_12705/m.57337 type:complete len:274 (-) Transcript_12705:72-893(-)